MKLIKKKNLYKIKINRKNPIYNKRIADLKTYIAM